MDTINSWVWFEIIGFILYYNRYDDNIPINCLWAGQSFTYMIISVYLSIISSFIYDFFVNNEILGGNKILILMIFTGLVLGEE